MTESCLSANVRHILCDVISHTDELCPSALNAEGILQWETLKCVLPSRVTLEEENFEYFVSCVKALSPVMRTAHQYYCNQAKDDLYDKIRDHISWMSEPKVIQRCIDLGHTDPKIGTVHSLLMCTAVLERSLGDLYLMNGKQCPSLLKDLLLTSELSQLLGDIPIHVLRVLIGPPVSLNLRNLFWHGFISPSEVHPQYLWMLICVIVSIGQILKDSAITVDQIQHRPMVSFSNIEIIEQTLLKDNVKIEEYVESLCLLLEKSSFFHPAVVDLWIEAINMFKMGKFGDCVCLLLPQLENGLRWIFAVTNNCPQRILTAENTVLFTTLDEILSPCLEDGEENKVRHCLGDQLMVLLLDLFHYPAGPKLRDKVSHGEAYINAISRSTAKILLSVCMLCMYRYEASGYTSHAQEHQIRVLSDDGEFTCHVTGKWKESDKENEESDLLLHKLNVSLDSYKCLFHPIALIKSQILVFAQNLERWDLTPKQTEYLVTGDSKESSEHMSDIMEAGQKLMQYSKHTPFGSYLELGILDPYCLLTTNYQSFLEYEIQTLYRTAWDKQENKEQQTIGLLHHIVQQGSLVAEQVQTVIAQWRQGYERKELHSRQRKTYLRILERLPLLSCGLRLVLMMLTVILYALDYIKSTELDRQIQLIKLLKFALKYTELLTTYTNISKNKWDEATLLTKKLTNKIHTTFDKLHQN